jgi:hypothetical protein
MFGKTPHTGTLGLRKQLLITESELNRAQLFQECGAAAHGILGVAQQARSAISRLSVPALLAASLLLLWHKKNASTVEKSSLFRMALKVARLASSILPALHAKPGRSQDSFKMET